MALFIPLSETADVEETLATPKGDDLSLSYSQESGPEEVRVLLERDTLLSPQQLRNELAIERPGNLEKSREPSLLERRQSTLPLGQLNRQCSESTRVIDALKNDCESLQDRWWHQLKEFNDEMNDQLEIAQQKLNDFQKREELCERITLETDQMTDLIGRMKTRKVPGVMLRDEKVHHRWQIAMWMRHTFRSFFGADQLNHTGFFVDTALTTMIHRYSFEVPYLRGNDILGGAIVPSKLKKLPGVLLSDEKKHLIETVIWMMNTFRGELGVSNYKECGDLIGF